MTLRRTRGEGCASDLLLDRSVSGDLDDDELTTLETHVASCAHCRERLDVVRAAQASFRGELPPELAIASVRRQEANRRWPRWGPPIVGALAMAAAVALFVRARPTGDTVETRERTKGGARVTFHVRHGDSVRAGVDDDRLAPGDAIEFSYSARDRGYLAIFSVDGARRASVYYAEGKHAARIEPGREVLLPQSTVLDETLGKEIVYALFCDAAVPVEPIRSALEAEPDRPPAVAGCTVDTHVFVKARR